MMAELKNVRHEKFAQCIASGMSQRKAYREAFPRSENWKDETVDSKASVLAKNEKVLERLRELADIATDETIMNVTERKKWLTRIMMNAEEETKEKLKACDILNKMEGSYIDKVEFNGQVNNPFAGMTTEELKKLIDDE